MLFLDTEFNSHRGQLISMALVSDVDGHEFYGVLHLPKIVHPWVLKHVVPLLLRRSESEWNFRNRLASYLLRHKGEDIVADWPEDFMHLLDMITEPDGVRLGIDFSMHLVSGLDCKPDIPHNALSDARALMQAYKAKHG